MKTGQVIAFTYNGQNRLVRVQTANKLYVHGWDYTAQDTWGGGYRSFLRSRMGKSSKPVRFNAPVLTFA